MATIPVRRPVLALAATCLIGSSALGQSFGLRVAGDPAMRIDWAQIVASQRDDWVNDLVAQADGTIAAVGFLNRTDLTPAADWHALALSLADNGTILARRTYGAGGAVDALWSVVEAPDGRRTHAGFTTRIGNGGINGYVLLTERDGSILKESAFGGDGYDRFTDIATASDGYVLLGHSQAEGSDKRRVYIVKVDRSGRLIWERIHDAPQTWGALYIEPVAEGFVIAGGTTAADGDMDMFAMKVDADGRELWRRRVGTAEWNEVNHGLVVRENGGLLLVGYTHARGAQANDLVAATLDPNGELRRLERFGGRADDRAILAKADRGGRVWIVGQTASSGSGGTDLLLTSLDSAGAFEGRAVTLGGPEDDNGTAVLPMADGSLLVAGYSRNLGVGGQDAFIAKLVEPTWREQHRAFRRTVVVEPKRAR